MRLVVGLLRYFALMMPSCVHSDHDGGDMNSERLPALLDLSRQCERVFETSQDKVFVVRVVFTLSSADNLHTKCLKNYHFSYGMLAAFHSTESQTDRENR